MKLDVNRPDLTVCVIGTGAMGRGIAQVTAAGGMSVLMTDARPGAADEAVAPTVVTGSLTAAFRAAFFAGRFETVCLVAGRFVTGLEETSLLLAVVFLMAFFGMSVSLR